MTNNEPTYLSLWPCVTPYDKWLYALKNLSSLNERPAALRDKIFDRLFQVAEIAKFTPVELKEYEDSLKTYRDLKNSLDTAEEKGRVEEKIAIARNLKSMGMSISDVSKATGLQEEEIKALWIYCNSIGFIGTPKRNNYESYE